MGVRFWDVRMQLLSDDIGLFYGTIASYYLKSFPDAPILFSGALRHTVSGSCGG
jgi:hypothetical protein